MMMIVHNYLMMMYMRLSCLCIGNVCWNFSL